MATETNYVYRVALNQAGDQGVIQNVMHVRRYDAVTDPTTAMLLAFANAVKELMRPNQHNSVAWNDWEAVQVLGPGVTYDPASCRQVGGLLHAGAFTGTLAGGITGTDPLPAHDALVVTWQTGERGRSRRGRTFFGGFAEGGQSDGEFTSGATTAIQTAVDSLLGVYGKAGTNANLRLVVFSRVVASGCVADPLARHHPLVHVRDGDPSDAWREVSAGVVRPTVFTQRSRTP